MSIKDLFNSYNNKQFQKSETIESASVLVEGSDYIEAKRTEYDRFVPHIDFSDISNFAKFGSAELYYENAFKRIQQEYPYDGTLAEKVEFENSSSYLDLYVLDNIYPRSNGYANFSVGSGADLSGSSVTSGSSGYTRPGVYEYVKILAGPHTASTGMIGKTMYSSFDKSMTYDMSKRKGSSLEMTMASGSTIEFWLKKRSAPLIEREVIFDLWNGEAAADANYGRLILHSEGSVASATGSMYLTLVSGSTSTPYGFQNQLILENCHDNEWHHYALVLQNLGPTSVQLYRDNKLVHSASYGTSVGNIIGVSSGLQATIGAMITTSGSNGGLAHCKLSGSIDEFRFWKKARTSQEIDSTWFVPVGGGTNKYEDNSDLGIYYKFNEGITTNSTLDSVVLDYSGRICDGEWIGYTSGARSTGSAIVESGRTVREFMDPIIYSAHPAVSSSMAYYKSSGSMADLENTSMLYRYFPNWMQETDTQSEQNLKKLSQIMGSYFDTLYHQINEVNKLHDHKYISGSNRSFPFAKQLLTNRGFVVPNLFVDATTVEKLRSKDENEVYEKDIADVRNTIYHNLYNNIIGIYKTKGTEKSFRNFFRSFGINSDLVKLKLYADDSTYVLRDNYQYKSYERNFLNFNHEDNHNATVYQVACNDNTSSYLLPPDPSGSFTLETEIVLPKKIKDREAGAVTYNYLSSSIMGQKIANSNPTAFSWGGETNADIRVKVVKERAESDLQPDELQRVKFQIEIGAPYTGSVATEANLGNPASIVLTSSYYNNQYDNNKWNLAVRVKHSKYPFSNFVSGTANSGYTFEFYGIESEANIKRNSFILTGSVTGSWLIDNRKRIYAGAERHNTIEVPKTLTDIKLGYVRHWNSYLSNESIDQHAYDSETFGPNEPFESDTIFTQTTEVPREKSLALHWAFNNLTTSDSEGGMTISDLSSGSLASTIMSPGQPGNKGVGTYGGAYSGSISSINQGSGSFFSNSYTGSLDKMFLYVARKRQPDDLFSSDLVTIKDEESENFFVDDDVSDNFYSFEKSLYGTISDEMMNMFSTALDFNNLIGQPNQKYHHNYNMLSFLKDRFFDDVENEPDLEKFTSFYKWIDDSISIALEQLYPASSRFSKGIKNVVESHVLERNKYVNKIGIINRRESTEGSMTGVQELLYDWKSGHAPVSGIKPLNKYYFGLSTSAASSNREIARTSTPTPLNSWTVSWWMQMGGNPATGLGNASAVSSVFDFGPDSTSVSVTDRPQIIRVDKSGSSSWYISVRLTDTDGAASDYRDFSMGNTQLEYNKWYHIVASFLHPGAGQPATNSDVSFWVNGVSVSASYADTSFKNEYYAPATGFRVCNYTANTNITKVDELTLITGSITDAQVGELYNDGKWFDVANDFSYKTNEVREVAGAFAHYRFGDTTGDSLTTHVQNTLPHGFNLNWIQNNATTQWSSPSFYGEGIYTVDRENSSTNCLWWRDRAPRDSATATTVRNVKNNHSLQSSGLQRFKSDGTIYHGSTYAIRKLAKPYNYQLQRDNNVLHSGVNFDRQKELFLFKESIAPAGQLKSVPQNIVTVGVGSGDSAIEPQVCLDDDHPSTTRKWTYTAEIGNKTGHSITNLKGNRFLPGNLVSGAVHSGYNEQVKSYYRPDVIFTNLHSDTTDCTNEIPIQGPFTEAHVGGQQHRHIQVNKYDVNKSLLSTIGIASTKATGRIQFVLSELTASDNVTVQDADQTSIVASYSPSYNLRHNKFSTAEELVQILNYRLDVDASMTTDTTSSIISLTSSVYGTDGNRSISTSTSLITGSGFSGGTNAGTTTTPVYLDSLADRPEGWAIVFKGHSAINDTDGAFGFIGADYGATYPNPDKPKATRFREEHAKRPVSVKNLWYDSNSSLVGNYQKGYEIFTLMKNDQRRWYRDAVDSNLHLPDSVRTVLPETTNYLTLVGRAPYQQGNVFGFASPTDVHGQTAYSNRYPDTGSMIFNKISVHQNPYVDIVWAQPAGTTIQNRNNAWLRFNRGLSGSGQYSIITFQQKGVSYSGVDHQEASGDPTKLECFYKVVNDGWTQTLYNFHVAVNAITSAATGRPIFSSSMHPDDRITQNGWDAGELTNNIYRVRVFSIDGTGSILGAAGNTQLGGGINGVYGGNDATIWTWPGNTGSAQFTSGSGPSDILTIHHSADTVITVPRTDLTSSTYEINSRFSAPGGPEIQSIGYLDNIAQSYSAYNALPFRNSSVLGSGSGEQGSIRVVDHLQKQRGLRTLLSTRMGQFGRDQHYGVISENTYVASGSYHKQHRNSSKRKQYYGDEFNAVLGKSIPTIITGSRSDNAYISSHLPRSDFQYSWIRNVVSGANWESTQAVLGHARPDGIYKFPSTAAWPGGPTDYDSAIWFPTGSQLQGSV